MKKLMLALSAVSLIAACETKEQAVLTGAALGAATGAATAGRDETNAALIGAVAGAIAGGAVYSANGEKMCRYVYPDGRETTAPCPEGY